MRGQGETRVTLILPPTPTPTLRLSIPLFISLNLLLGIWGLIYRILSPICSHIYMAEGGSKQMYLVSFWILSVQFPVNFRFFQLLLVRLCRIFAALSDWHQGITLSYENVKISLLSPLLNAPQFWTQWGLMACPISAPSYWTIHQVRSSWVPEMPYCPWTPLNWTNRRVR